MRKENRSAPPVGCFQLYAQTVRHTPLRLPPYRHLPGVTPHPVRDPLGHSFGLQEGSRVPWREEAWWLSRDYLFGVDLYNWAYYWEAHEAWEAIWQVASDQESRHFLQGLIQVSAGLLKRELGNLKGLQRLTRKGLLKLQGVEARREFFGGLRLAPFSRCIDLIASASVYPGWVEDPRILLEYPPGVSAPGTVR